MYNLGDIPRIGARNFPHREAVVHEGTRLTYLDFNKRINRLANALIELGCTKGDCIAILSENTHKYLEVYFAAAKLSVSINPLNTRLSDQELRFIVNNSDATLFLVSDEYAEKLKRKKKNYFNINTWIALDKESEGFLFYESLLESASDAEPNIFVDENEMAVLMFTGGTTGVPKGVMLSHRNIMTSTLALTLTIGFTDKDITCCSIPFFHISIWSALCLLLVGGKVVINKRPSVEEILKLISAEKCTHMNLVPTVYIWMLNHPELEEYDLSSLRLLSYGGSPFPPEALKKGIEKFGNIFIGGYGLTEAAPFVTYFPPEDHIIDGEESKRLFSAGKISPSVDLKIVDEEGNSLNQGEIGEIAVRGKNIMLGYWNDPELNEKTLKDGWFHTADIGYLDEDGFLYLVDRKADMIVTGGENVYPKETEDILYQHPAVLECAVVSAPDKKWGERVQAVVILKKGKQATEKGLITHCTIRLPGYKCPKAIEFWDELPKNSFGKILRKDVKKHFWKGSERLVG